MLMIGVFLLVTFALFYVWNSFSGYWKRWGWGPDVFFGYLITFKIIVTFLVYGNSFLDLRAKSGAERYLLIPATKTEKIIAQIFLKVGIAEIILPLVFWLSANFAGMLWTGFLQDIIEVEEKAQFTTFGLGIIWPFPPEQNWAVYALTIGFYLFFPSILFAGNLFFGKWNVVLTPLSTFIFYLILAASSIGLSQMLFEKEESIWSFNISIDQPEIFTDVPLMILLIIFLLYAASALSSVVAYFKLKEREV